VSRNLMSLLLYVTSFSFAAMDVLCSVYFMF
jgi:hypothetical protein